MDSWVEWGETRLKKKNSFLNEVQLICIQNIYSLYMFLGNVSHIFGQNIRTEND